MYAIQIQRAYDPSIQKGRRILVDRIWPRGVKKEALALDEWNRDVAPSADLRRWFDHRPDRFEVFSERYREELEASRVARHFKEEISRRRKEEPIWLIYGAKDETHNHALVLKAWLEDDDE